MMQQQHDGVRSGKPTVGSLFAGIGGFDLGFERAGFETVWQVEINEWARRVLAKNFPKAERYADIRECGSRNLKPVDVIVGGFPCQDISNAGLRAGIEGERSGLWREFARIIGELRPRFVLVENVAALLSPNYDKRTCIIRPAAIARVLGDLAEIGYVAEWEVISAADLGAPHRRDRVWILAYAARELLDGCRIITGQTKGDEYPDVRPKLSVPYGNDVQGLIPGSTDTQERSDSRERQARPCDAGYGGQWAVEPNVGRVAYGVPKRVDRLRGLGNAVVPQIPEIFARRIFALLNLTSNSPEDIAP
jgi:DNA (cytosine-5)-methyltransferase 1